MVSTAFAGTVWKTMQKGLHAASLLGRNHLCGIQPGTVAEAGVLNKTVRFEGGAHMRAHMLQGKQALVFLTKGLQMCSRPPTTPPWDVAGKTPMIQP